MMDFIKKNKFYVLLFFVCVLVTVLAPLFKQSEVYQPGDSPALAEFKKAEELAAQKVESKGGLEAFLVTRPDLALGLKVFTLLILFGFFAGVAINLYWIFKPELRTNTKMAVPPSVVDWNFSMFFRVFVLFYVWSLILGLLFAWLQESVFGSHSFNIFTLVHTTVVDFLCLGLMIWTVQEHGGRWKDLGFHYYDKNLTKELKFGLGAYLAVIPAFLTALVVLIVIVQFMAYEPPAHPLVNIFLEEEKRSLPTVSFSIFLAIVIGPILEEIFFRGFCYPIFKKRFGIKAGMIISSALFAAIHANIFAFIPIFILGMVLAFVYEHRGSLIGPMFMHVIHNSVFITYFFFSKHLVQSVS